MTIIKRARKEAQAQVPEDIHLNKPVAAKSDLKLWWVESKQRELSIIEPNEKLSNINNTHSYYNHLCQELCYMPYNITFLFYFKEFKKLTRLGNYLRG